MRSLAEESDIENLQRQIYALATHLGVELVKVDTTTGYGYRAVSAIMEDIRREEAEKLERKLVQVPRQPAELVGL